MSDGAIIAITAAALVGIAGSLVWALADAVRTERRGSGVRRLWSNFGLSITFCVLFLVSWLARAFAEWARTGTRKPSIRRQLRSAATSSRSGSRHSRTGSRSSSSSSRSWSCPPCSSTEGARSRKDGDERIERRLEEISARLDALATERSEATG
jgi:hypothetical protein